MGVAEAVAASAAVVAVAAVVVAAAPAPAATATGVVVVGVVAAPAAAAAAAAAAALRVCDLLCQFEPGGHRAGGVGCWSASPRREHMAVGRLVADVGDVSGKICHVVCRPCWVRVAECAVVGESRRVGEGRVEVASLRPQCGEGRCKIPWKSGRPFHGGFPPLPVLA